jgi:hypothetical protein
MITQIAGVGIRWAGVAGPEKDFCRLGAGVWVRRHFPALRFSIDKHILSI